MQWDNRASDSSRHGRRPEIKEFIAARNFAALREVVQDLSPADMAEIITINGLTHSEVLHLAAGVTHLSTLLANTGAIDVTGSATLHLTGAFTAPAFGSLSANGGLIKVSATLDLVGGNMQNAGTSGWQIAGGTIKGGTLDGVKLNGTSPNRGNLTAIGSTP